MDINNPKHPLNPKNPNYQKNVEALAQITKKLVKKDIKKISQ